MNSSNRSTLFRNFGRIQTFACLWSLIICAFAISSSRAAIVITAVESGSDVVFSTSDGSLNTTDLTFLNLTAQVGKIRRDGNNGIWVGLAPATNLDFMNGATQPADFVSVGVTGDILATSGSGSKIGVFAGNVYTPKDYVSGTIIPASTSTYAGQTFASLGLIDGTYTWSWGSGGTADFITLEIETIPEPATASLLGLGVMVLLRRKRSRS